jgi:thiol-disulfide isomerase/thioredoxin
MGKHGTGLWLLVPLALLLLGLWIFLYRGALFSQGPVFEEYVNQDVPELVLGLSNGQEVSFRSELKSRFAEDENLQHILLSFWATWCAPCVKELPMLEERASRYSEGGLGILLLNFDHTFREEDRNKVMMWLQDHTQTLSTLFDPKDRLIQRLELSALPFNAVVNRDLRWVWGDYGLLEFKQIEERFVLPPKN